jgi:archaemetzincin
MDLTYLLADNVSHPSTGSRSRSRRAASRQPPAPSVSAGEAKPGLMPGRPVVAIAPMGEVERGFAATIGPAVAEAFEVEITAATSLTAPTGAFSRARGQYLSTAFLDVLARAKDRGWERLLGVTGVDLYVPRLNFVFGEADPRRGVAVFSVHRLRSPEAALFARRAATEAVHELGHTYGLGHCRRRDCAMWFSNTLTETDRKGPRLCPAHASEVRRLRRPA